MDIKNDTKDLENSERKEPNPWPSRVVVSPLEDALHHTLGWDLIAILRTEYDHPALVLEEKDEELEEKISRPKEIIEEVKSIIKEWDKDPERYLNPFASNDVPEVLKVPQIQTQTKIEVRVK